MTAIMAETRRAVWLMLAPTLKDELSNMQTGDMEKIFWTSIQPFEKVLCLLYT